MKVIHRTQLPLKKKSASLIHRVIRAIWNYDLTNWITEPVAVLERSIARVDACLIATTKQTVIEVLPALAAGNVSERVVFNQPG
jgi:hypothetical protein